MHETSRKPIIISKRPISTHNIVVVRAATKEAGFEKDPEIQRIQVSYKFFLIDSLYTVLKITSNTESDVSMTLHVLFVTIFQAVG